MELAHFVISFNIEYFDREQKFSNVDDPSYFDVENSTYDPLGNGEGDNDFFEDTDGDGKPEGKDIDGDGVVDTPMRISALRVTLVMTEGPGERQERLFQRVFWLPRGW